MMAETLMIAILSVLYISRAIHRWAFTGSSRGGRSATSVRCSSTPLLANLLNCRGVVEIVTEEQ